MTRSPLVDIDIERLGAGIWVDPDDRDGWANALRRLHDDPDEAAAMGRRGRALVDGGLDSRTFAHQLMDLFDSMLGIDTRRRPADADTTRRRDGSTMTDPATTQQIAFLGPEGTFSEEALLANLPGDGLHPFPYPSIRDVLKAVESAARRRSASCRSRTRSRARSSITLDSSPSASTTSTSCARSRTRAPAARRPAPARPRARDQGDQHPARLRPVPRLPARAPAQRRARTDRFDR